VGVQQPALIIHGHFYQPPRENPWTGLIDREPSAQPAPNWNERIHQECYRANATARVFDDQGRVVRIVNNYRHLSFNFGPTLMTWLERWHPDTYASIIQADRDSAAVRGGHGNAIAQGYNHTILPLSNERDRRTQIRWGLADFRHRFGREAESLWLPETACNDETLGALIDEGLRYVLLSPFQAERVRPLAGGDWQDASHGQIDPRRAYRYHHRDGSGRHIAIFFYDGHISRAVAFERALVSSSGLLDRFAMAAGGAGTVAQIATDGESYGHHHRMGERCLAYALSADADRRGFWVTNYGEFLDHFPPEWEAEIKAGPNGEGTAWSCSHGVGRWIRDCSCHSGAKRGWNQQWRTPLRTALDFLRDESAKVFETMGADLFADPWAARDAYIDVVVDPQADREAWLTRHAARPLDRSELVRALTLLEMQRDAMLMYTSCGWFFADLSGIETIQILKYAARVLDYLGDLGAVAIRKPFLQLLTKAKSNLREWGSGANIFRKAVEPVRVRPAQVAATVAFLVLAGDDTDAGELAGYRFRRNGVRTETFGGTRLATLCLHLESVATLRTWDFAVAVVYGGGTDFTAAVAPVLHHREGDTLVERFWSLAAADGVNLPGLAADVFGSDLVRLPDLQPDDRYRICQAMLHQPVQAWSEAYAQPYRELLHYMDWLRQEGHPVPPELLAAADLALWREFGEALGKQRLTLDPSPGQRAQALASEAARKGHRFDKAVIRARLQKLFDDAVTQAGLDPQSDDAVIAMRLLSLADHLGAKLDVEVSQERLCEALMTGMTATPGIKGLATALNLAPSLVGRPAQRGVLDPAS
jgi:alpha-amylase/alpha-mannosidase (GH57 family)